MDNLSLKNKKVLVTGGNGYLGSHLVAALRKANADVFVIDKEAKGREATPGVIMADLTDQATIGDIIRRIEPTIIFHLAAILDRDRDFSKHDRAMNANYYGTKTLLTALENIEYENFIFTSTSEIYGDNTAPFNETQLPQPASVYSLSKCCAEALIQTFSRLYNKNYTILRLFNFFGTNMPANFFIPQLLHALKHDESFKMTKGEQKRDFLYIDDVVQALFLAAENSSAHNQLFNVCSGNSTTLKQLVTEFKDRIGGSCRIDFGALPYRKNEVWDMVGNNDKIKKMLNFNVNYDIKAAIDKLARES
ncbi:MAG: NAD-dependent epimerase/dehydratase family protein [Bacteroidia bacterium]